MIFTNIHKYSFAIQNLSIIIMFENSLFGDRIPVKPAFTSERFQVQARAVNLRYVKLFNSPHSTS